MTLTKAIIVTVLLVIAFNLFYYARYQRAMAEVRRRAAEEAEAERKEAGREGGVAKSEADGSDEVT